MGRAKRAKEEPIEIEASSGNVFEDLGLPDAGERLAKAELARVIRKIVKDKNWTQRRAADVLGIAPPDVSDLMRGKLARFSQERLERFLNALDMDVHIRVGPRAAGKKQANVTVELVAVFYMAERRIGIRELKSKLSECVREVRSGGTIVVTARGRPVARIAAAAL